MALVRHFYGAFASFIDDLDLASIGPILNSVITGINVPFDGVSYRAAISITYAKGSAVFLGDFNYSQTPVGVLLSGGTIKAIYALYPTDPHYNWAITDISYDVTKFEKIQDLLQGNDTFLGWGAGDIFLASPGADYFNGRGEMQGYTPSWSDTIIYTGKKADYSGKTDKFGTTTVIDNRIGSPDGTDKFVNIEFLQFTDGTYAVRDLYPVNTVAPTRINPNYHFTTLAKYEFPIITNSENGEVWIYYERLTSNHYGTLLLYGQKYSNYLTPIGSEIISNDVYNLTSASRAASTVTRADGSVIQLQSQNVSSDGPLQNSTDSQWDFGPEITGTISSGGVIIKRFIISHHAAQLSYVSPASISLFSDQSFVVAFKGSDNTIWMQRYSALGDEIGGQTQVAPTITSGDLPAVKVLSNDNFIIVWHDLKDDDNWGMYAKLFSFDGTELAVGVDPLSISSNPFASVAENLSVGLPVYTCMATAQDQVRQIVYSIFGGADATQFNINALTGAVTFKTSPNYEAPLDNGLDNVYDIVVQASDGSFSTTKAIAITVANVNEAPIISSLESTSSPENVSTVTVVYTATATDPDPNTTLTYSISGADAGLFNIIATTGAVTFKTSPNYEAPADAGANNVYDITVRASDGSLYADKTVAITVTNINEAPGVSSLAAATTSENVSTSTAFYRVAASDPDANTTLTYSISGGADANLFNINATTGAVTFKASPNFEAPADADANNVYDIVVQATDGSLFATQGVAITVTNVNETPSITSVATSTTPENISTSTAIYTATATDPDANTTLRYSISGGADAALFNINASTGAVTFKKSPNYEAPADAGENNVYDITVRASDELLYADKAVAMTVSDALEKNPPINVFASKGTYSSSIEVTWVQPTDTVFNPLRWDIYRASYPDSPYTFVQSVFGDNRFVDNNVNVGALYLYEIRAYSYTQGVSDFSEADMGWRTRSTIGTSSDDTIIGNDLNDSMLGYGGNDTICGFGGNDTIDGGSGTDTAIFQATFADSTINQNSNGTFTIASVLDGADTIKNVEYVQFSDQTISLIRSAPQTNTLGKDFNGDGKSDFLFQNSTNGACYIWQINGLTISDSGPVGPAVGTDWKVKATGDFNGDSKSDLLFQNATNGACYVWELNGLNIGDSGAVGPAVGTDWKIKAIGDFNGDGKSDFLFQNATNGACYIWELNGLTIGDSGAVGPAVGTDWQVKATGDFNGDGKSDLLFQNSANGACYIWEMNGLNIVDSGAVGPAVGTAWQIKATGDFNGDGKSDLLFQNAVTGACYIWEMNGLTISDSGAVGPAVGTDWQIKATGDFNGDGNSDLLFQNATNGACYIWELNGLTIGGSGPVGPAVGTDWHVMA